MILIQSVKFITIHGNMARVPGLNYEVNLAEPTPPYEHVAEGVNYHLINGQKFKNARGEVVRLGATKEVEEILGLPFKVFNDLTDENKMRQTANQALIAELEAMKNMNFWHRLKFLFNKQ